MSRLIPSKRWKLSRNFEKHSARNQNKYNRKNCYIFTNNICIHFEWYILRDCKQCLHLWWRMCPTFCFELFHTLASKQIEHFTLLSSILRLTTYCLRNTFASCVAVIIENSIFVFSALTIAWILKLKAANDSWPSKTPICYFEPSKTDKSGLI